LSNLFFSLFADPSVFSEKNVPVSAGFRRLDVSASVPEFLSKSFG
jgi:prolyl-tRNA editing enzyme YbaK/EbsC (Cys-tRNA(Pro) deacylase)